MPPADRPDHTGSVVIEGTVTITGSVTITGTVTVTGDVNITNSSIAVTQSGTWNVTVTGSVSITNAYITVDQKAGSTWTISGSVTVSSGTVSISGTVTITGDVNVTNSVLYIATSGGTNIIIDKLTQDAYVSRNATLYPGGETGNPTSFFTDTMWGVWWPYGCIGWIEKLWVYLKNTTGSALKRTYAFSHSPGGPDIIRGIQVTQAANTEGWREISVRKRWNYSSLFIYNYDAAYSADLQCGYFPDPTWGKGGWYFYDGTSIVARADKIPAYRVDMVLPVGTIPVSGTVSNIQIPNTQGALAYESVSIDAGATKDYLATIYGAGKINCIQGFVYMGTAQSLNQVYLGIVIDGVAFEIDFRAIGMTAYGGVLPTSRVSCPTRFAVGGFRADSTENLIGMSTMFDIPFQKSARVYFRNGSAVSVSSGCIVGYELLK